MIGITTVFKGREYRIPDFLGIFLVLDRQALIMEGGGGHVNAHQKIRERTVFEFTIAEFDAPTERISRENDFSVIDEEYIEMANNDHLQKQNKLRKFRRIEAFLKKEGLV